MKISPAPPRRIGYHRNEEVLQKVNFLPILYMMVAVLAEIRERKADDLLDYRPRRCRAAPGCPSLCVCRRASLSHLGVSYDRGVNRLRVRDSQQLNGRFFSSF